MAGCLVLVVHFVAAGFCFTIHCGYDVAWFVVFENVMKVSEKAKEGRNVFAAWVCERAVYKGEVTAENKAVAVEYVYSFVIEIHMFILE